MMKMMKAMRYARKLLWFLELLVKPEEAAAALLEQPRVKAWLEQQPAKDQKKIREATALVVGAIVAAMD